MLNLLWESSSTSMDGKPPIHGSVHKSRNAQAFFFFFFLSFSSLSVRSPPFFSDINIIIWSIPPRFGWKFFLHSLGVRLPPRPTPQPPPALTILWKGRSSTDIHICMYVLQTGVGVWRLIKTCGLSPRPEPEYSKLPACPAQAPPRNISPGGVTYYFFFFFGEKDMQ